MDEIRIISDISQLIFSLTIVLQPFLDTIDWFRIVEAIGILLAVILGGGSLLTARSTMKKTAADADLAKTNVTKALQEIADEATNSEKELRQELRELENKFSDLESKLRDQKNSYAIFRVSYDKAVACSWVLYDQLLEARIEPKCSPPEKRKSGNEVP